MDALEQAEALWENIRYSQVMDIDDMVMESIRKKDLKTISLTDVFAEVKKVLKGRGI